MSNETLGFLILLGMVVSIVMFIAGYVHGWKQYMIDISEWKEYPGHTPAARLRRRTLKRIDPTNNGANK